MLCFLEIVLFHKGYLKIRNLKNLHLGIEKLFGGKKIITHTK